MVRVFGIAAAVIAGLALVVVAFLLLNRNEGGTPEAGAEIHFTAAGDFSATDETAAVLTRNASLSPDFTLALGDLSYGRPGGEQEWCDFVTSKVGTDFPFQLIAGNHESDGRDGNINDFSACLPNRLPGIVGTYGREWYVDVPAADPIARFVMISPGLVFPESETSWDYSPGSEHYAWTESAIDGARDSGIPWVIVGNHMPCLSIGEYSCTAGEELTNLLISKKVDLVLNGHEHLYQRTYQIGHGDGCAKIVPDTVNEECITDTDSSLAQGAGTVFATIGTGGIDLREANSADPEAEYFAARSATNANPTHGLLDVSVTERSISAEFVKAAGGTFDDFFTIRRNPDPQAGASFSENCAGLGCALDASTPLPAQGKRTYEWDFGNGETATGVRPAITYDAPGDYEISLTVKDRAGSDTVSKRVSVTEEGGAASTFSDPFERTTDTGWGDAEEGGAWTDSGEPGAFSVADGTGILELASPASGTGASLKAMNSSRMDLRAALAVDRRPAGGSAYLRLVTRQTESAGSYRTVLQFSPEGELSFHIDRVNRHGSEVRLGPDVTLPDLEVAGGEIVNVRAQTTGASPTALRAKVWKAGEPEPAQWQIDTRDSAPGLQTPGAAGINTYLSPGATNAPVTFKVEEITGTLTK